MLPYPDEKLMKLFPINALLLRLFGSFTITAFFVIKLKYQFTKM